MGYSALWGWFFVTEREGNIAFIEKDGKVNRQQIELEKETASEGEGRLLGFALDEDFDDNQKAYVYHNRDNNNLFNRIVKIKKEDNSWIEQEVLLEEIPGAEIHNGGRLKIGPEECFMRQQVTQIEKKTRTAAGKPCRKHPSFRTRLQHSRRQSN
ncbi:sorbosone dehydrogenase family protein [Alteribacillus sp. JSM 102045]|uniref:PQQ-dependent sugar dehydrogenase n=1 Tax=Alteribacillus sp. JSM 102045 TaxID=1562101 RepID=UPI0035C1EB5E